MIQLSRRMVDGELSLTYELVRNTEGMIYDRRFGIGFSMTVGGTGESTKNPQLPADFQAR